MSEEPATEPAAPPAAPYAPPPFAEVYRDHVGAAWRALAGLGVRREDLADACQEVFVVVHRRLPEFDGRHRLGTWVHAICLRVAASFRRRAHVRREELVGELPERAAGATPHERLESERAMLALQRLLDGVAEDKREVFILYELCELPMREVAELVGCPLQTAYSRLHAARRAVEAGARALRAGEGP